MTGCNTVPRLGLAQEPQGAVNGCEKQLQVIVLLSGVDKNNDTAVTFLNVNDVSNRNIYPFVTNTLSHELGHQFIGDVYQPLSNDIGGVVKYFGREAAADGRVAGQAAGVNQQAFGRELLRADMQCH